MQNIRCQSMSMSKHTCQRLKARKMDCRWKSERGRERERTFDSRQTSRHSLFKSEKACSSVLSISALLILHSTLHAELSWTIWTKGQWELQDPKMEILYHIKLKAIFWGEIPLHNPWYAAHMPYICLTYGRYIPEMAIGHHWTYWTRIILTVLTVLTVLTGQAFERSSAGASALSGSLWCTLFRFGKGPKGWENMRKHHGHAWTKCHSLEYSSITWYHGETIGNWQ
jgi:hypothetical protein